MAEKYSRRTFFGSGRLGRRAYDGARLQPDSWGQRSHPNRPDRLRAQGSGHRQMLKQSAQTDPNFDLRSVCDLWSVNRERAADDAQRLFGMRPKTFKYSEEMLADPQLDAVMIATGDFQHARILAEVVRAGKDCYCEKPMANTLEDAKLARDTVAKSDRVVQMGSQWLS